MENMTFSSVLLVTSEFFNCNGRCEKSAIICLNGSLLFGLLCLTLCIVLHVLQASESCS